MPPSTRSRVFFWFTFNLMSLVVPALSLADSCYMFERVAPPMGNDDFVRDEVVGAKSDHEIWCYRQLAEPSEGTLIYKNDGQIREELAAFVDSTGHVAHASIARGVVTFHRVDSADINPLPVPLREPRSSEHYIEVSIDVATEARIASLAARLAMPGARLGDLGSQALLKSLSADTRQAPLANLQEVGPLDSGVLSAKAPAPWRGYWWPYSSGRLAKGSESPMAKYDRFARARGVDTKALDWERKNHRFRGLKWEGHCNGWAASAILRAEPRATVRDTLSETSFTSADLKGLLAERDACMTYTLYGRRYRGRPKDDLHDIEPRLFHQALTYFVGHLKKPVIIDRFQGVGVDNHIVSAYTMTVENMRSNELTISARLTVHGYDKEPGTKLGRAPSYTRTFKYTLHKDAEGKFSSGRWLTKNPDFLWVPLGISACSRANPHVRDEWLDQIFALPTQGRTSDRKP